MQEKATYEINLAHAVYNWHEVSNSSEASCFYCIRVMPAKKVVGTCKSATAVCPTCGVDAVLGDASGLPIKDVDFLRLMHLYAFTQ